MYKREKGTRCWRGGNQYKEKNIKEKIAGKRVGTKKGRENKKNGKAKIKKQKGKR